MDTNRMANQRTATPRWMEHSNHHRMDWESRFPDKHWHQHEHAYRYGWEHGANPQWKGRSFDTMGGDMERGWANRYDSWSDHAGNRVEGAWNDFKDTVREGWHAARREFEKTF